MGKYSDSSGSDYDRRSRRKAGTISSSRRRRSSSGSSHSSDSTSQSKYKRKSSSKSSYSRSRRSRSSSSSRQRRNRHKERYRRSRSRHRSSSESNRRRRSRSKSFIREYTSKRRQSTSSTSSTNSSVSNRKSKNKLPTVENNPKLVEKDKKPIDLQKYNEVEEPDVQILSEINSEGFQPKKFSSMAKSKEEKILIDLHKQTIKVPEKNSESVEETKSIFHHNLFQSEEQRMEKWVKDLYMFRQKALQQGAKKT